jgi:tetratricopeptide (TPR) repeat protein
MSRTPEESLEDAMQTGNLGERDEAIDEAVRVLSSSAPDRALELVPLILVTATALRSRWKTRYDTADLNKASELLENAIDVAVGGELEGRLQAAYAFALQDIVAAIRIDAVWAAGDALPIATERIAELALDAAERALRLAKTSDAEAEANHAAGLVHGIRDEYDDAVRFLREALRLAPWDFNVALDLAIALASRSNVPAELAGDVDEARELFEDLEQKLLEAPRIAFEAGRFHGFWASNRADWPEAADALFCALAARRALRESQPDIEYEQVWLEEAGSLPSEAAFCAAKAGWLEAAIEALENGLCLWLSERLGVNVVAGSTVAQIREAARPGLLIYIIVTRWGGMAFVVNHDPQVPLRTIELPSLTKDALASTLMSLHRKYGRMKASDGAHVRESWLDEVEAMLAWVGTSVTRPLFAGLPADVSQVAIVSDGLLGLLPVHASASERGSLLDYVTVRYIPTASSQLRESQPRSREILCVGAAGEGVWELRFADLEAKAVAAMYQDSRVLVGGDAQAVVVEREMATSDVAHLACHGFMLPNDVGGSGLIMGDGKTITLRDLAEAAVPLRLAVLSACESGVQGTFAAEEKISLPGALLAAGAIGVAAALWTVGDRTSALLALRFHDNWREHQSDPADALREAQCWLRDSSNSAKGQWLARLADEIAAVDVTVGNQVRDLIDPEDPDIHAYAHPNNWAGFAFFGK